jgi:hypothetical protein
MMCQQCSVKRLNVQPYMAHLQYAHDNFFLCRAQQ